MSSTASTHAHNVRTKWGTYRAWGVGLTRVWVGVVRLCEEGALFVTKIYLPVAK